MIVNETKPRCTCAKDLVKPCPQCRFAERTKHLRDSNGNLIYHGLSIARLQRECEMNGLGWILTDDLNWVYRPEFYVPDKKFYPSYLTRGFV